MIHEQVQAGGAVFPWHDSEAYIRLVLEWSIQSYLEHVPSTEPVFSDQGIPDINARIQKAPAEAHKAECVLLMFRRALKYRTMCDTSADCAYSIEWSPVATILP